jgi:hypothetical protein
VNLNYAIARKRLLNITSKDGTPTTCCTKLHHQKKTNKKPPKPPKTTPIQQHINHTQNNPNVVLQLYVSVNVLTLPQDNKRNNPILLRQRFPTPVSM